MISFGIDFGTTNTAVVGCLTTENGLTTTAYGENNQPFPSLVALHPEKDTLFGSEVKKRRSQLISEGYTVLASFKTILGSGNSIAVGKKKYSPLDVTALFLAYIKERVEKMAGCAMNEAVMAIPVDFSSEQRADLREAAHRAGICIKSFVSEPTAIGWGKQCRCFRLGRRRTGHQLDFYRKQRSIRTCSCRDASWRQ